MILAYISCFLFNNAIVRHTRSYSFLNCGKICKKIQYYERRSGMDNIYEQRLLESRSSILRVLNEKNNILNFGELADGQKFKCLHAANRAEAG